MIKRLSTTVFIIFMAFILPSAPGALGGMVAVDDRELASVTAQTGINLYGSLKATAGNLIISGTAGGLKLGGWRLNNATTSTADPANSSQSGFSQWGPFSFNVGYHRGSNPATSRAVGRIGLDTRINNDAPTWIFKNIQIYQDEDWSSTPTWASKRDNASGHFWNYDWDPDNPLTDLRGGTYAGTPNTYSAGDHGEEGWIDIGGLYLTTIHLWESYIDIFNDGITSDSQIQGYGRFHGTVERITIQWGQTYLDGAAVIDGLTFCRSRTAGATNNYMTLGNPAGDDPLVWDQTSNFRNEPDDGITMFNMRIWFPFQGSLYWDNLAIRDTSYTRATGQGGRDHVNANGGYLNLGRLQLDNIRGTVSIDFPQQENPANTWWNY